MCVPMTYILKTLLGFLCTSLLVGTLMGVVYLLGSIFATNTTDKMVAGFLLMICIPLFGIGFYALGDDLWKDIKGGRL